MMQLRDYTRLVEPYAKANNARAWFQFTTTLALFIGNWILMVYSLEWSYAITILLAFLGAGLLARLFIFQHDCGHGSFFDSSNLNDWVGRLIGVITFTPYEYWRWTHNVHHRTSGNLDERSLGDINVMTVSEYQTLGRWQKFCYRAYRHPFVLFGIGPVWQFVFKHRLPLDTPLNRKKEWRSVIVTNLALLAIATLIIAQIGWKRFLLVQIPIGLIGGVAAIWLFYVQHQFENTYWRRQEEWNFVQAALEGSSFLDLPPVLEWFTGNIGYHPLHHLSVKVPNYHLKRCYEAVPEVRGKTRLTLWESFACAKLALWDESRMRLVSFNEARTTA